ncbi:hypothetical protein BKA93DRAFT_826019 [Sparassis latifolia]
MSGNLSFLGIPAELRLVVYELYLSEHQHVSNRRQPSNHHIRLLYICKQVFDEAVSIIGRYVSLQHERQINAFILHATESQAAQIQWADVANDGRVSGPTNASVDADQPLVPLSNLHLALRRMTSLTCLRVFQCRQGIPINIQKINARLAIRFEHAMYPSGYPHHLTAYELFLDPETRVTPFEVVLPQFIEVLRVTGECRLPAAVCMPALRHLMLYGITGNHFDQHTVEESLSGCRLHSFVYGLGHRLGFEIRNRHLESLTSVAGAHLRKLVLLGCSRLTSTVIAACLENMPKLEHFALSLVTVDELRTNFVLSLPPTISVFKLQLTNAWYAIPLLSEERGLCNALEDVLLRRPIAPRHVCVCFRNSLMIGGDRQDRWKELARNRCFQLDIGLWQGEDLEDLPS